MIYLYGNGDRDDTIVKIATLLNCDYGTHRNLEKVKTLVVGWGNSVPRRCVNVLNREIILDKFQAHKELARKVQVPRVWDTFKEIPDSAFPVLGRDFNHSRGTDIELIVSKDSTIRKDYYVQYIPKVAEYRVHVLGDKIYISQKLHKYNGNTDEIIAWNTTNGFAYHDIMETQLKFLSRWLLKRTARKAIKVLDYDFGAVDIMISKANKFNKVYALEVNSAPGLIPRRAKWYADYFKSQENTSKWSLRGWMESFLKKEKPISQS